MKSVWLDANMLIRLLTNDSPEHAERSERLMRRAARGDLLLVIPVVVIAEVVWTLKSFYRYDRDKIADGLQSLVAADGVAAEAADTVLDALTLMAEHNVDFADAYVAAAASRRGDQVATFDADLARLGARVLSF